MPRNMFLFTNANYLFPYTGAGSGVRRALEYNPNAGRVNQQVQNYKTCLKNLHFGVEKFNFSLGLSFNFFCIDIILLSV